jgi:alpha-1,2-mannosyltransferase
VGVVSLTGWVRTALRDPRVRALLALACLAVAVTDVWTAYQLPAPDRMLDVRIYQASVRAMLSGGDAYAVSLNGYPFTYPPVALLVLLPTAAVSVPALWALWTLAVVATAALLARLAARRVDPRLPYAAVLLVALASGPVQHTIDFGQIGLMLVTLAAADALGRPGRRWGGIAIGVCAAVKLTPLAFVPWLVVVGRRRDAARAVAAFVACTAVAWLVLPAESRFFWTRAIGRTDRVGDAASVANQSLHGLLLRAGLRGAGETAWWLALGAVVSAIALVRSRLLWRRGAHLESVVVVGCATLLVSPITWSHHEGWTVLAVVALMATGRRTPVVVAAVLFAVITWPLPEFATHVSGSLLGWPELRWPAANARVLAPLGICLFAFGPRTTSARSRVPATPSRARLDAVPAAAPGATPAHQR